MSAAVLPADPYAIPQCGYGILADAFGSAPVRSNERIAKHFRLGIHYGTALAGDLKSQGSAFVDGAQHLLFSNVKRLGVRS